MVKYSHKGKGRTVTQDTGGGMTTGRQENTQRLHSSFQDRERRRNEKSEGRKKR